MPYDAVAQATVDEWIRAAQLLCGFVVIQVEGDPNRDLGWARRCGQIARQLGERRRLTTVVVPSEARFEGAVQRAIASSGGHALAAPPWGLVETAALVRRARLFLGSEPGWLQLSAALGTPTLGLCKPSGGGAAHLFGDRLVWIDSCADLKDLPSEDRHESILELPLESIAMVCARLLDQHAVRNARVA